MNFSLLETASNEEWVDIEKLDYGYIGKCENIKELESILNVLKSGREGVYPHLEDFTRERIEALKPSNGKNDELEALKNEISDWQNDMKQLESQLKQKANITLELPSEPQPNKVTNEKKEKSAIKSLDFRKWDQLDIEKMLEELDQENPEIQKPVFTPIFNTTSAKLSKSTLESIQELLATSSEAELKNISEKERIKGNECFKLQEYKEALQYYTKSLLLFPQAVIYSNRSLVYFKMKLFDVAIDDASQALVLDETYWKAYLRRANAYFSTGQYLKCLQDCDKGYALEPNNEFKSLREKALFKLKEVESKEAERKLKDIKEQKERRSHITPGIVVPSIREITDDEYEEESEISSDEEPERPRIQVL